MRKDAVPSSQGNPRRKGLILKGAKNAKEEKI
jgi:hypothetical protein